MNEMQCIKHDLQLKQWSQIIQDRQASGKSIKRYCEEHHIRENTYYYWQKVLRERAVNGVKEEKPTFVALDLTGQYDEHNASQITLQIKDINICVTNDFSPETLAKIIRTVRASC